MSNGRSTPDMRYPITDAVRSSEITCRMWKIRAAIRMRDRLPWWRVCAKKECDRRIDHMHRHVLYFAGLPRDEG